MFVTTLLVLTSLMPRAGIGLDAVKVGVDRAEAALAMTAAPAVASSFLASERAVSNWRTETGTTLRPVSLALVARYAPVPPAFVARCVKLNNYWCIKSARWRGEIGSDAEGHTGFATAGDGADAAALLLRRYYREFGRRNALSIVRRWAPAECSVSSSGGSGGKVSTGLAPLGLGKTLRARYLARHARGGPRKPRLVARGGPLRVQPWSPLARMAGTPKPRPIRVAGAAETIGRPAITAIIASPSETPTASPSSRLADRFAAESAALPALAAGMPGLRLQDLAAPAPLCGNDEVRIRNYATRIAASVGLKIEDDLALFDAEGRPSPRLAPVMLAMSGVELGALRAGPDLVEAAIARLVAAQGDPGAVER
ncbi:hypothetical protein FPV16_06165 [Methylobacterium sp. W2]|uniref:hypothetical protein n=1 Tax=Methylobacterium sp. W2 TaxID=2598107 RepID=UPI001D0CA847|nr:hypothetical protein [Methylobacterium sp. W2]MCC0805810.1 hypothetical protein [Methylobacterium sp. W2]